MSELGVVDVEVGTRRRVNDLMCMNKSISSYLVKDTDILTFFIQFIFYTIGFTN